MISFLYAAVVYVVGRMFWYSDDRPKQARELAAIGLVQWIALVVAIRATLSWTIEALAAIIVLAFTAASVERALQSRDNLRWLSRLCVLLAGLIAFGYLACHGDAEVRPGFHQASTWIASQVAFGSLLTKVNWPILWSRTLGMALCWFEGGTVVRLSMALMNVQPPKAADAENKFHNSALIGAVERALVVVFVFNGAFNAVAFILTAKSVVRFHDIVSTKDAAEYVLIGTLLSTLTAIGIGLLVPQFA